MRRTKLSHLIFVWLHPILAFSMLCTTVGMAVMYSSIINGGDIDNSYHKMVSVGALTQMICLILMRIEHKGWFYTLTRPTRVAYIIVRVGFAWIQYSIFFYNGSIENEMMLHALVSLFINFIDMGSSLNLEEFYLMYRPLTDDCYPLNTNSEHSINLSQQGKSRA